MDAMPSISTVTRLLQARYGDTTVSMDLLNETIETILAHRSVRGYADRPLPPDTLDTLCAAAQSASTSSNLQTWSVIAIEDAERKARLSDLAGKQEHIRRCPLFLVWIADLARLRALGVRHEAAHGSLDYFETFLVATIDAALAAQNAAVAAESMGMGVVYIGGMRNHPEEVAKELLLPPGTFATFGMCVGYPDTTRPASIKPRLSSKAVLHREVYDASKQEAAIETYNETMARFYREQGMQTHGNWDMHSLHRVRGTEAMQGRERLVEALKNLGFALR